MAQPAKCAICCHAVVSEEEDHVVLHEQKEQLHVSCFIEAWQTGRRPLPPSCGTSGVVLDFGDTIQRALHDPLASTAKPHTAPHEDVDEVDGSTSSNVVSQLKSAWSTFDKHLRAGIESSSLSAIRAGDTVRQLQDRGIDASVLLRDDNNRRHLFTALMESKYTVQQMVMLGFDFQRLVEAGLTRTRLHECLSCGSLSIDGLCRFMGVSAATIASALCDNVPDTLPSLLLFPEEWQQLCGSHTTPAAFMRSLHVRASQLKTFETREGTPYTLEQWATKLGLVECFDDFQFTDPEIREFVLTCASAGRHDPEAAAEEFKIYFNRPLPDAVQRDRVEAGSGARGHTLHPNVPARPVHAQPAGQHGMSGIRRPPTWGSHVRGAPRPISMAASSGSSGTRPVRAARGYLGGSWHGPHGR